jgi:hypothetical protein
MGLPSVVILSEFQSSPYFLLEERAAGTYKQISEIRGNSILSSIFVKAIDPGVSIQVNYYDTTTGAGLGERYELKPHNLVTDADAGKTFRIIVSEIHRRVVSEVIVTGGNATFSVYATAVTATDSNIDSALIREGQDYSDPENKAMPAAYLDETTNKLFFLHGKDGALIVTGDVNADRKNNPSSRLFNIPTANTEVPLIFEANAVSISVTNETTNTIFKASWQSGESATQYFSIKPGQQYKDEKINSPQLTLYVQADKNNVDLHVAEWT